MKISLLIWSICLLVANTSVTHAFEYEARALLKAQKQTVLSSQIGGKIKSIKYRDGDSFKKDNTLVAFDCSIQKAKYNKALAEKSRAMKKLENQQKLAAYNAGSVLELDLAKEELKMAKAEVSVNWSMMKMCSIKAPFNGKVVEVIAQPHQSVNAGVELMEIIDNGPLEINMIIPSAWLSWVRKGASFRVKVDETGQYYSGKVNKIGAKIDAVSQTVKIYGLLDKAYSDLIAGMSGVAYFEAKKGN